MPTSSGIVRTACYLILAFTSAANASAAKQHLARKVYGIHATSKLRPWDANAALASTPSELWAGRLVNGAESAPAGH
jgi:hypothetical protein